MAREQFLEQESRGGIGPHQITVTEAEWRVSPEYSEKTGKDTYFLHWYGTTNIEDRPIMDAESFHHSWSTDPDFLSVDGKTLQSQSGKKKEVGKAAGRMMKAAAEATVHLEGTPDDFLADASPLDASIWVGHTWEMEEVELDFGGQIGKKREFHPVRYVGKASASTPSAPAAPAAPAAPPTAPNGAATGVEESIKALVQASPDFDTFRSAALAVPGLSDRPELMIRVVDETSGFWAEKG